LGREKVRIELIPFSRPELRLIGVDSLERSAADCALPMERLCSGFESGAYAPPPSPTAYRLLLTA